MILKIRSIVSLVLLTASCSSAITFTQTDSLAPIISLTNAEVIPDSYLVVLKENVLANDHSSWFRDLYEKDITKNGAWHSLSDKGDLGGVRHIYDIGSFQGIAGRFRPEVLDEIRRNPYVDYVEHDQVVYPAEIQKNAPWGLARISHRDSLNYKTKSKYDHNPDGGEGITVFVIDSGILLTHQEFEGRASWGATFLNTRDPIDEDEMGHGTHCAGTVAGATFGVAKKAQLVAVKVIGWDGMGTGSDLLAGLDYVYKRHLSHKEQRGSKYRGSVVSMSLIYQKSKTMNRALQNAADGGLHFAVAAGNYNEDACDFSPSSSEAAVTVGASNFNNEKADFSSYGPCVDVFAPGVGVLSAGIRNNQDSELGSGTSMATPHVAGLIAYYLSLIPRNGSAFYSGTISPPNMKRLLKETATRGVLKGVDANTPNLLVYNGGNPDGYIEW
ncbi:serine protease [Entomortierella beljakovae]|nr:serine protease [Entomortierella beljakovae]